ncbi:low specificity L-threonine aldolase [Cloacibacillus evryensis]|uniref:threonine aldolase family protein n=1 Tax=Cloacibacillus evryensis TaxID=508460 RepID=UPI00210918A6|nr:low specificity L-threonine aldolase [Cloacibacillus evryensis]MCQ4765432.1 low specificity L-threonine aldolase [Cloacibacillus evryensis]
MIRFECDYGEGAHPRILERLAATNMEQTAGYGEDPHCEAARGYIRELCRMPDADVHFLVGGTQANLTVIAAALRPHQGVIAAESGHINVHETGAIEATGHKVITVPGENGKITAGEVRGVCDSHWRDPTHEHIAQPAMVYISNPSEIGTIYTLAELEEISKVCRKCGLPLFMDGARLGYGLACELCDYTLADIAALCDVFYIGGTKVGALFGEAVVITDAALKRDFRYIMKQRGAMLAKGRLLGIQFEALFEDGLYFEISRHATELAMKLRAACTAKGYPFLVDSMTNQQFPILPNSLIERLKVKFTFSLWQPTDAAHTAVRFCTSWATKEEHLDELIAEL